MKLFHTIFLGVVALTLAEIPKPQVTIGISNQGIGKFGGGSLGGLEPAVKWQTKGSTSYFDWEAGLDVTITDLNSAPYTCWGKVKRTIQGFALSVRGAVASKALDSVDMEVRMDGPTSSVQVLGKAGSSNSVSKLAVRKVVDIAGAGKLIVNPRYDVGAKEANVGVTYAVKNTSINVDSGSKKLTLAQLVGDKSVVMPSITMDGTFDVAVQQSFDFGKVTTTLKPKDSVSVKWEEGPYIATVNAPIDGITKFQGIDVTLKRKLDF